VRITTVAPSGIRRPIASVNEPLSSAAATVSRIETALTSIPRNRTTDHGVRRSSWSGSGRSDPIRPGAEPSSVEIDESSVRPDRSRSMIAVSRP
jgi:hypothetical protein